MEAIENEGMPNLYEFMLEDSDGKGNPRSEEKTGFTWPLRAGTFVACMLPEKISSLRRHRPPAKELERGPD